MLARGIELPPIGSLKDRVLRRGMAVERAIKVAEIETLLLAQNFLHGDKKTGEAIFKMLDYFKEHVSLEVFTKDYQKKHNVTKAKDVSLLHKLNNLGKLNKTKGS